MMADDDYSKADFYISLYVYILEAKFNFPNASLFNW